jgi:hypothetical protein
MFSLSYHHIPLLRLHLSLLLLILPPFFSLYFTLLCILKVRPHYPCSCSGLCASVNVDGFTSPSPSSAIIQKYGLEKFATVSVQLSVHTGQKSPQVSAARVQARLFWTHLYNSPTETCHPRTGSYPMVDMKLI